MMTMMCSCTPQSNCQRARDRTNPPPPQPSSAPYPERDSGRDVTALVPSPPPGRPTCQRPRHAHRRRKIEIAKARVVRGGSQRPSFIHSLARLLVVVACRCCRCCRSWLLESASTSFDRRPNNASEHEHTAAVYLIL